MADHDGFSAGTEPDVAALIAARPHLRMDPAQGLMLEGVALAAIAGDLGTPCWVYGAGTIRGRLAALRAALAESGLGHAHIHYAVKANDHLAILAIMAAGPAPTSSAPASFCGPARSAFRRPASFSRASARRWATFGWRSPRELLRSM
jgi:hypothetical protein